MAKPWATPSTSSTCWKAAGIDYRKQPYVDRLSLLAGLIPAEFTALVPRVHRLQRQGEDPACSNACAGRTRKASCSRT